jgi:predicted O-methyltransferase YrrM
MEYYMEYGGGLGDVFLQMYAGRSYALLERLGPDDHATIALICHNPHARELFDHHSNRGRFQLEDFGYWPPERNAEMRARHRLPRRGIPAPAGPDAPLHFYPAPSDTPALESIAGKRCVIFSVSAGLPGRGIPPALVEELSRGVSQSGLVPVFVGRNYQRWGRAEYRPHCGDGCGGVVDLVDRLSVPGVARAVEGAAAVVCCHSAINLLAWFMRRPQLLLYPPDVYDRHIVHRDPWSFGADFPECRHALFDDPGVGRMLREVLDPTYRPQEMRGRPVKTVPLPPESRAIDLDPTIPRLTAAHEVRFLCWLARRTPGNIVEIGTNKGLTSRDLARANPDRIIYAVDYFASDGALACEQRGERPSADDFCVHARDIPNVVCVHARSATLNYAALNNVRLVFVDGDHRFDAVKADTDAALEHLRSNEGGVIVWHDYFEQGPAWVGVKRYVDTLDLDVHHVEGTWLAMAEVPGRRKSPRARP